MNENYADINASTIDRWIDEGWEWGIPISHESFEKAKRGEWEVFLTPTKPVPRAWLGDLRGKKVLGLASGGGQQMPVFAALGAECTVLDYSSRQLESERAVSEREHLQQLCYLLFRIPVPRRLVPVQGDCPDRYRAGDPGRVSLRPPASFPPDALCRS